MASSSDWGTRSLPELARTWAPGSRGRGFGQLSTPNLNRTHPHRVASPTALPRVPKHRAVAQYSASGKEASLSATARRANNKAERCLQQYAAAVHEKKQQEQKQAEQKQAFKGRDGRKKPPVDKFGKEIQFPEHRPEVFEETANQIGNQIETLTRNIRLEHLCDSAEGFDEVKAAKEREEARKKRMIELMRARKKEQEARDPHRKVALRLENTRRFKQEEVDKMPVPMTQVHFEGANGHEKETMVDVRLLRARCLLIDEGARVEALMDLQKHREKNRAEMNSTAPAKFFSPDSDRLLKPIDDADIFEARIRSQERTLDLKFGRLSAMRSEPTQEMLNSLETEEQRSAIMAKFHMDPTAPMSKSAEDFIPDSSRAEIWKKKKSSMAKASVVRALLSPKMKKRPHMDAAAHQRAQRNWVKVRFAVFCFMLYALVRRKKRAVHVVVDVLNHLGEWARVQSSVRRLMMNVRILQRAARNFLQNKRRRIELMEKDWLRVEAKYLRTQVQALALASADEDVDKKASKKSRTAAHTIRFKKTKRDILSDQVTHLMYKAAQDAEWQIYCIPPDERRELCARYYMILLKKRVKSTKNLYGMMQHIVRNQREMRFFFRQFGAEPDTALGLESVCRQSGSNFSAEHVPNDFWHLSEDTLLDLIALIAKRLSGRDPWRHHPANRDIPGNVMYRSAIHAVCGNCVTDDTPIRTDILRMLGDTADLRQQARKIRATSAADRKKTDFKRPEAAHMDVEDILGGLTPRHLREFSQKNYARVQTPASRSGNRASRRPRPPSQQLFIGEDELKK